MRVTNRGGRKWEVGPGNFACPGCTVEVSADSWRVALGLNPALAYAVGSELVVEEDAHPAPVSEPDYAEPAAGDEPPIEDAKPAALPDDAARPHPPQAAIETTGRSTSRSRKGRR